MASAASASGSAGAAAAVKAAGIKRKALFELPSIRAEASQCVVGKDAKGECAVCVGCKKRLDTCRGCDGNAFWSLKAPCKVCSASDDPPCDRCKHTDPMSWLECDVCNGTGLCGPSRVSFTGRMYCNTCMRLKKKKADSDARGVESVFSPEEIDSNDDEDGDNDGDGNDEDASASASASGSSVASAKTSKFTTEEHTKFLSLLDALLKKHGKTRDVYFKSTKKPKVIPSNLVAEWEEIGNVTFCLAHIPDTHSLFFVVVVVVQPNNCRVVAPSPAICMVGRWFRATSVSHRKKTASFSSFSSFAFSTYKKCIFI